MKIPLLGGTGEEDAQDVSSQLTQNWYVQKPRSGKSPIVLYPTPGLTEFTDVGTGPIRGQIEYGDVFFIVSNNELYEINSDGTGVLRGTLNTNFGRVGMAHNGSANGQELIIVDGTNGYIWDSKYSSFFVIKQYSSGSADTNTLNKLEDTSATFVTDGVLPGIVVYNTTDSTSGTVSIVSETVLTIVDSSDTVVDLFPLGTEAYEVGDNNFPDTATHVIFFDSFFLVNNPAVTGRFSKSAGYDGTTWDSLEFATAERDPDRMQGLIISNRQLWLVGTKTAEKWFNSGARDFPFEPDQSGFSQWGTIAPYSIIEVAGITFWLSQNDEGAGLIVMTGGGNPQVIAPPEISSEIENIGTITDCYSFAYQCKQHAMVAFSFPSGSKTFVYDMMTQEWHQWSSKSTGYHQSTGHTYVFNKHLAGSPTNGKIYQYDWSVFTDNGDQITRIRRSANIHGEDKSVRHHGVFLDIKEGVGDLVTTDPKINLRFKDNNGSWSNYKVRSMGKVGEYNKKIIWRKLGRSRDRVYEISVTDPVNAVLVDGYARLELDRRDLG